MKQFDRFPFQWASAFKKSLVFAFAIGVGASLYSASVNPELESLYRDNELNRFVTGHLQSSGRAQIGNQTHRATLEMITAVANLNGVLTSYRFKKIVSNWFLPENLIYIFGETNELEQSRFAEILNQIVVALKNNNLDLEPILENPDAVDLVTKVRQIDAEVSRLKKLHKILRRLAVRKHEEEFKQSYGDGDEPYSYHLKNVRAVLKRFGYGARDSLLGLRLGSEAWLHDIIEDTDVSFEELKAIAGEEIALGVLGVTKLKPIEGKSKLEMLILTYQRTAEREDSRILKLADRIANVEEGIVDLFEGRPSKVKKYFAEWPVFFEALYVDGEATEMWLHLERLLTDPVYAFHFVYGGARSTFQCVKGLGSKG